MPTLTAQDLFGNEICQFVVFYSLGAFANRYPNIDVLKKNRYWIVALASVLLLLSNIILNLLAIKMPVFNQGCYFYSRNSVLIVAIAYGLLLVFTNITIKPSRIINTISSTTFGIYLIHDNHHLREFIWGSLLQVDRYKYSDYLVLFMPLCIAAVFVACAIIDYFRQILLERPLLHVLEPLANRISQKTESVTEEKQLLNKRY